MISQVLRDCRKYEEEAGNKIPASDRPSYHFSTRAGWLNDPNGFSYYNGKYHLFYQYNPYSSHWDTMHWGHAVSEDLLHWEYLPAVLAPDMPYDHAGCFSGSAITLPDGRHLLMYTGVSKETQPDGSVKDVQVQCLAVGDGVDYKKYAGNPVITENDIPEDCSKYDFRDPKMFGFSDGTFGCVIAGCKGDDDDRDGRILLFVSDDGFDWHYEKVLEINNGRYGKMWECPDFFDLDGKRALIMSPQDMLPSGFEYHNGNGTLCMLGTFDEGSRDFKAETNQSIDYGIDFYAPQTMLTPDGRRVMIAWMQNWDTCNLHSVDSPWFGQMTLPRELFIKNNRLYQLPVKEIETLRTNKKEYKDVKVTDVVTLDGVSGRCADVEISVKPGEGGFHKFAIRFAQNDKYYTSVSFRPHESIVKIDRKFSGSRRAIIHQRRCEVKQDNGVGVIKLRLIIDKFSVEVFINDGEYVMTATLYTDMSADGISFYADGNAVIDVTSYNLG